MDIPDFGPYTIDDLEALIDAAKHALDSKQIVATAEEKIDHILAEVKTAQGIHDDDDWVQPTGPQNAYPARARVRFNNKIWESLTTANTSAPDTPAWREYVRPGTAPPWVQPTGSANTYGRGAIVFHNGKTWRSTHPVNVWEPGIAVPGETPWAEMP